MKAAFVLTYILLAMLLIFGLLSFFRVPAYEKGVWLIFGTVVSALSGLLGFIFGIHMPRPDNPEPPTASSLPPNE